MDNIIYSKNKYERGSARKARLVVDMIRGKMSEDALAMLTFVNKRAAVGILKTLQSAVANAENNFDMDKENLVVAEARIDEGITMKRARSASRGRSRRILKRTHHVVIGLKSVN